MEFEIVSVMDRSLLAEGMAKLDIPTPLRVGEHGALTSFGKPLQQHSPKCS